MAVNEESVRFVGWQQGIAMRNTPFLVFFITTITRLTVIIITIVFFSSTTETVSALQRETNGAWGRRMGIPSSASNPL